MNITNYAIIIIIYLLWIRDVKDQVKVRVSEPLVIPLIIELNNFYADDFDNVQIYNNNDNLYCNFYDSH